MGWRDTHAHEFEVGVGTVTPDWWIHEVGMDRDSSAWRDERRRRGYELTVKAAFRDWSV
jgi:hypothetical protein